LSIGSGKAHLEYHLSKKLKFYRQTLMIVLLIFYKKIKIKKFNILTCDSNEIKKLVKFYCIIISNIEYLFTTKQLKKFF
jgi:hypothetical protein